LEPLTKVAKRLGISDVGLAKACARANVPTPPRGYWAKQEAGKPSKKSALPVLDSWQSAVITIVPTPPRPPHSDEPEDRHVPYEDIAVAIAREKKRAQPIPADESLRDPHRIIRRDMAREKQWKSPIAHASRYQRESDAGEALKKRQWSLLSGLFKALEERGHEIGEPYGGNGAIHYPLTLFEELVTLQFKERIRQARRDLTKEERARSWNGKQLWTQERFPTGELMFSLGRYKPSPRDQWSDHPDCPLETQLHDVLLGLYYAAADERTKRIQREEAAQREREAQHHRWLEEQERQRKAKRVAALVKQANDWQTSSVVRSYIAAVNAASRDDQDPRASGELAAWSTWASQVADSLDPVTTGNPLTPEEKDPWPHG
jgi:hypothetical protein